MSDYDEDNEWDEPDELEDAGLDALGNLPPDRVFCMGCRHPQPQLMGGGCINCGMMLSGGPMTRLIATPAEGGLPMMEHYDQYPPSPIEPDDADQTVQVVLTGRAWLVESVVPTPEQDELLWQHAHRVGMRMGRSPAQLRHILQSWAGLAATIRRLSPLREDEEELVRRHLRFMVAPWMR